MNKKTIVLTALVLTLAGLTLIPQSAQAYKGDPNIKGPYYSAERHEAMTKAFANKDYNAWKNLMQGRGRVTQVINEKNFAKFVEAHNLTLAGKINEANKIKAELGLGLRNGTGQGYGRFNR